MVKEEILNIGCGMSVDMNRLVEKLNAVMGKDLRPVYTDPRPGDIRQSLADISDAEKLLGYSPEISLEEGLKETVEYFLKKK